MTTVTYDDEDVVRLPKWTTSTNLGTLTRASFPPECLKDLARFNNPPTGLGPPHAYNTQGCALNKCCPSGGAYTEDWAYVTSYYSPGVCPSEYKRCDFEGKHPAFKTASNEIVRFCCPSNYACPAVTGDLIKPCQSVVKTRQLVVTVYDDVVAQMPITTTTMNGGGAGLVTNVAYPIQVRFKQGEDAELIIGGRLLPTVGSPTLLVALSTPTAGPMPGGGGGYTATGADQKTSSGISSGVVVTIILAAAAAVAIVLIVAAMRVVRKRRREQGLPISVEQAVNMRAVNNQSKPQQHTGADMGPKLGVAPDHRQRKLSVQHGMAQQHHGSNANSRPELQNYI